MGSGTTGAAIVAKTFWEEQRAALPLKSTVSASLRSVHEFMRAILARDTISNLLWESAVVEHKHTSSY